MKRLGLLVVVLAALVVAVAATAAAGHIAVKPGTISPGGVITVAAASSLCLSRDQVILISTAFPGHAYGKGAVYGHVAAHGAFTVRAHVRSKIKPGRYSISFRCGGGNLGVSVYVRIR
jgi:hypothetical protein